MGGIYAVAFEIVLRQIGLFWVFSLHIWGFFFLYIFFDQIVKFGRRYDPEANPARVFTISAGAAIAVYLLLRHFDLVNLPPVGKALELLAIFGLMITGWLLPTKAIIALHRTSEDPDTELP